MPIPSEIKTFEGGGSSSKPVAVDDIDEDTMESTCSSTNLPTSNLVAPDSLKRQQDTVVCYHHEAEVNNENGVSIEDYIKDSKTLNVNVMAEKETDVTMNNEINFDSDKFSKHHDNARPQETIENLNLLDSMGEKNKIQTKRFGIENRPMAVIGNSKTALRPSEEEECCLEEQFGGIKRIRLDSSDKEKNVQLEKERQSCQNGDLRSSEDMEDDDDLGASNDGGNSVLGAVALSSSPLEAGHVTDPQRLKDTVDADRHWEKHLNGSDTIVARTFQVWKGTSQNVTLNLISHLISFLGPV